MRISGVLLLLATAAWGCSSSRPPSAGGIPGAVTCDLVESTGREARSGPRGTTAWTGLAHDGFSLTSVRYRIPDGWVDDGLAALHRDAFVAPGTFRAALLASMVLGPPREDSEASPLDPSLPPPPGHPSPVAWIWAIRPEVALPADWLLAWDGLADAQLPPWTVHFRRLRAPAQVDGLGPGSVALSVGGVDEEAALRVDAVFVRRGGWLLGVAVAGRDDQDRTDIARLIASSLRASNR